MAEFIMKELVRQAGLEDQFIISSAATTTEELGNDMYPNAKAELKLHGIPFERRRARQIKLIVEIIQTGTLSLQWIKRIFLI